MARVLSKQDIRRNPLAEWVETTVRFVQAWRTVVLAVLAAISIVGGAGGVYWWYQGRQEDEAGRALAKARAAIRGDKTSAPGDQDQTIRHYQAVAQKYQSTRSGEEALIHLGNLQFAAGQVDEAAGTFGKYLTIYPWGRFRMLAGLGEAYSQEAKGDLQGAALTLSKVLDSDKDDPLAGEAYIALARMYDGLKKHEDAMRIYGKVVEQFGQTQWSQQALTRMGNLTRK